MTQYDMLFKHMEESNDFEENGRLAQYITNILQYSRNITVGDRLAFRNFALGEMQRLTNLIPITANYRTKDSMFFYENYLLGIYTLSSCGASIALAGEKEIINQLIKTVEDSRKFEKAVESMFDNSQIDETLARHTIELAKSVKDDYERAMMYRIFHLNKEKFDKFTAAARKVFADYIADDLETVLSHNYLSDDDLINLEYSVDVCTGVFNQRICDLLQKVLATNLNKVRYYAIVTLLENGESVDKAVIRQLAEDLGYANLTYYALKKYGKTDLFPQELATAEYLAESDMVQWLMYPTELGKKPDKIELLGVAKKKKQIFHIFKYMSDSNTLTDDRKNKWLIGWASEEGGTFSDFSLLSDFEKKTKEKTVKHIAKKLL